MSAKARVIEDADKAPIISSDEVGSVSRRIDLVNVSAIFRLGVDTLSMPGELHSEGLPNDVLKHISAIRFVLEGRHVPEEEFIGSTVAAQELTVSTPVKGHDVRVVSGKCSLKTPVTGVVDVDLVVMRTNSKRSIIRAHCHAFNPLCGIFESFAWFGSVQALPDMDTTIIGSDNKRSIRSEDNSAGALRSREV